MRTFHTGGVAGDDITQGLPRVEELFEARTPKGRAIISELSGKAKILKKKTGQRVIINSEEGRKKPTLSPMEHSCGWKTISGLKPVTELLRVPSTPRIS